MSTAMASISNPTSSYVNYQLWGYKSVAELGPATAANIEAIQSADWFNVPYQWISAVGGPWESINYYYNPSPSADQMYASKASAVIDLQALRTSGASWESAQAALRNTKDISGFKIYSPDTGAVTSAWLTLAIADGTYVSVDMMSGMVLNGTFDQLIAEVSGYGTDHRNPGQDLSFILQPNRPDRTFREHWLRLGSRLPVPSPIDHQWHERLGFVD
ncbi:hypothetical protein ACVWWG_003787 [Bradyrhizobium sp. LB7.2]